MTTSVRSNLPEHAWGACARLLLATFLLGVSTAGFAQADTTVVPRPEVRQQSDADKDDLIRELVALTDAAQLQAIFSRRLIDRVANAVTLFSPNMDARAMRVVREEATDVVQERIESGDALYSVLYPVYEKHFNIFELNQLVTFYQSPLGQKLVRVSPQLLSESMALGQQWGLSLVPEIAQRVQTRLSE